jgi:hypothetical protein
MLITRAGTIKYSGGRYKGQPISNCQVAMNKPLRLLFILLVFPLVFQAQTTLTGLWVGTLSNDSTTLRKNQTFEIALTQYRGKVYGYSRMNFFVNDTLYYIVKRVKGTVEELVTEVKDDEIITHNFPRQPDKGVKMLYTFRRNPEDSIWRLDGEWKTTASKKHGYYSISGKITLASEPDLSKSKIFPHLEELDLAKDVAFYAASKKKEAETASIAANTSPANNHKQNDHKTHDSRTSGDQKVTSPSVAKTIAPETTVNTSTQGPPAESGGASVAANTAQKQTESTEETAPAFTGLKKTETSVNRASLQQPNDLQRNPNAPIVKSDQPNVRLNEIKPSVPEEKKPEAETAVLTNSSTKQIQQTPELQKVITNPVAVFFKERKTIAPQVVEFVSDSLEIKLYDNGEVDGDTVSILMNGSILMAKQGLKASAIRKTIYIPKDSDEITLVLYAENLGKYPPNTGLVVIRDGEEDYQVRFSADLQQNAAITLRRKK